MRYTLWTTFVVMIFLGSCISVNSIINPIKMETIDYRDYEYVIFTSEQEVNLTFVSSDEFDSNALTVMKVNYYPADNETKYKFTSNEVSPDPWFEPGLKDFIYQDENTGQLYIISIDYSGIEVPLSEIEILYNELFEDFENLTDDYSILLANFNSWMNKIDSINNTLSDYADLINETVNESISRLYNEFLDIVDDLESSKEYILNLREELNETWDNLNITSEDLNNQSVDYLALNNSYNLLNETYNSTYSLLLEKGGNLSEFEAFKSNLNSNRDGFYFRGQYYWTINNYEKRIQQFKDDAGMFPIYMALVIIFLIIIFYVIYRMMLKKQPINPLAQDTDFNYPREAGILDKFSMGKIFRKKDQPKQIETESQEEKIEMEEQQILKEDNVKEEERKEIKENKSSIDDRLASLENTIQKLASAKEVK